MTRRLSRRGALLVGAGLGAVACTGIAARTIFAEREFPDDGPAYEPWRNWRGDPQEGPRGLIRTAILAANAHNTQPWLFCIGPDRIELFADMSRNLGAMDPFRREMHLSLGCALENLGIAARAQGYAAQFSLRPGSLREAEPPNEARHIATITLSVGHLEVSPLFAAIPRRHTNRGPYDPDRSVPADAIEKLASLAKNEPSVRLFILTDHAAHAEFAAATVAATKAIVDDEVMIRDSDAWFRMSADEIASHRDGPTIDAAGLSPAITFIAKLLPPASAERSHAVWLERTRDVQLATAGFVGLIAVRDLYDSEQAMQAGRLWQRLHLQATLMGLAMQPINQLPEMVDRELQLSKPAATSKLLASLTGDPNWRPTFTFRGGWPGRSAPASPRRTVESVVSPKPCSTPR